jgi:hypothetical protein
LSSCGELAQLRDDRVVELAGSAGLVLAGLARGEDRRAVPSPSPCRRLVRRTADPRGLTVDALRAAIHDLVERVARMPADVAEVRVEFLVVAGERRSVHASPSSKSGWRCPTDVVDAMARLLPPQLGHVTSATISVFLAACRASPPSGPPDRDRARARWSCVDVCVGRGGINASIATGTHC